MAKHSQSESEVSRREYATTLLATGVGVGLAGCVGGDNSNDSGNGNGNGDSSDSGSGNGDGDVPHVVEGTLSIPWTRPDTDLPRANLNRWAPNFRGQLTRSVCSIPGAMSANHGNDWFPLDLVSFDLDEENDEIRCEWREDIHWSQGGEVIDDFTAEDVVTMYELLRYMTPESERNPNPPELGWRADDDKTFVVELNPDGYNVDAIYRTLRNQYVTTYRNGFFGEKLEELKDASSEDEEMALIEEVSQFDYSLGEDLPLCGPWMLDEVHENVARFSLNEDHWVATGGPASPNELEIHILGGGGTGMYQGVDSGTIAIMDSGIPSSVPDNGIPDTIKQISFAGENGLSLLMNYGGGSIDPYMGVDTDLPVEERTAGAQQAKVRQGIAHAINFDNVLLNHFGSRIADLADPYAKAHPTSSTVMQEEFPDLYEQLPSYVERDTELAEQRLEEAGLELEDGTWVKPNGDSLQISLQASEESLDMLRTINEDLQNVGLNSELETLGDQADSRYLDGTISVAMAWILDNPINTELQNHMVEGEGYPDTPRPGNYEIPPIGEMDAEPDESLDVIDMTADFNIESLDDHRDDVEQLLWAYAYHLPQIPLFPNMGNYTLNTEEIQWPEPMPEGRAVAPTEDNHPIYGTGFHVLTHPHADVRVPGYE